MIANLALSATASGQSLILASTTSTEQSGLLAFLLPAFKQTTGIEVKVLAVGTGQALDMARRGDADVLLVHDRAGEDKLVAEGFAVDRRDVMHNDFVLLGPSADPMKVRGTDIVAAHRLLANGLASQGPTTYVSRGDKSGTHAAELRFWALAGGGVPASTGYRACGCGMGPALNMASDTGAYVLADRGTWLSFKNRGSLEILVQGDPKLFNPYGVLRVNPARHPHVKVREGQQLVDWLTSAPGQALIASYRIGAEGLFFPVAKSPMSSPPVRP